MVSDGFEVGNSGVGFCEEKINRVNYLCDEVEIGKKNLIRLKP